MSSFDISLPGRGPLEDATGQCRRAVNVQAVLPPGYRRGYIDGSIIVYSPHTQIVIDVVPLFRR